MLKTFLDEDTAQGVITDEQINEVIDEVITRVTGEFGAGQLLAPSDEIKREAGERIAQHLQATLQRRGLRLSMIKEKAIADDIASRLLGLGFLDRLLPPARTDLTEIMLNADGRLWVIPKGESSSVEQKGFNLQPREVFRVIDGILGPLNLSVNEANPIVQAKLPRSKRLPGGARVSIVHPCIANGDGFPTMNIRLYEPKPVKVEKLLEWQVMNEEMATFLQEAVRDHLRIMISGGTATGKTTTLSALANFIPDNERIALVEDPAEIFIDHPNVVSLEARAPNVDGKYGVPLAALVAQCLRMTPRWIVVGEVRDGFAATALLSAQMSDHPGLSTIHADSPRAVVERLCLLAQLSEHIRREATKYLIALAIDLFVQVNYDRHGIRRVTRITEVGKELKGGNVYLSDIFRFDQEESTAKVDVIVEPSGRQVRRVIEDHPVWHKVGERTRVRA